MSAAPLPANESQRLSALLELGLLDTGPEEDYDALAVAVAQACDCPIGSVSLVDATRQWFKAAHGLALSELPRENSFCAHAILGSSLFVIADTLADVRFCDNPFALAPDGIRFYAGMPLQLDGVTLGTLAVMDTRPRELGPTQRQALQGLARVAVELLRSRRRVRALHEERTRLHDLARASGDWMWELDAQLRYRWISGQFEPVTGLPPHALLGHEIEDAPLLDASGMPLAGGGSLLGLLRERLPFSRVVTAKHTPRGRLLVSRSALPVVDEAGHFRGWRGTARDVTSRIDAEHNAAQHDERLRKLSSQIPGLIFQYLRHADGRSEFPFVSRGVEAVFGVSAEEVAREPSNAFQIFHPQDRQRVLAGIERSAAELTVWYDEYRVVRRDGQERWLETRASPERLPDGATLWHAFSADVTDRMLTKAALRLGEARWEMAARATGMGLAELDLANGRLQFDERACRNHGLAWPSPHFTLGDWVQSIHPDDRDRAAAAVRLAVQTRGALDERARVILPDGRQRVLEFVGQAIVDAAGAPTGILATCRDVTEQAEHERLRQDKESAERANRAKSEFLSRMSHELRTPLNGILGFAQLMSLDRGAPLSTDQQHRLDNMVHAGRHLLDLINDVLELARAEHQHGAMQPEAVDGMAAMSRCLSMIAPLADQIGVQLPAAPAGRCWVQADRRALEQVLMNLLSNAIKYNRRGGRVGVHIGTSAGSVQFAVSDEGPGLTPAQQARLFQHFERLGAETSGVPGSGLGLVISRELAQSMGGELQVQSRSGAGSTFTLVMPGCEAPPDDAPLPVTADDTAVPVVDAGAARVVLYIEDEPLNVLLMQEVFRLRGAWQLRVAGTGRDGLAMAAALQPDAVLIDIHLPDMGGVDVVRALRGGTGTRQLRCIALSADAMAEQIDVARAAGFDDYWTKPIDVPQVLAGLDRVLA